MLLNRRISILYFIKTIWADILILATFAIVIGILDQYGFFSIITIPLGVTTVFGTAVALLLAFRTNQSYERWWEARIIWGAIVNDSRTLIRQTLSFNNKSSQDYENEIKKVAQRQIIWCYALGEAIRKIPFSKKVKNYLDKNAISSFNVPNALLSEHSRQLAKMHQKEIIN